MYREEQLIPIHNALPECQLLAVVLFSKLRICRLKSRMVALSGRPLQGLTGPYLIPWCRCVWIRAGVGQTQHQLFTTGIPSVKLHYANDIKGNVAYSVGQLILAWCILKYLSFQYRMILSLTVFQHCDYSFKSWFQTIVCISSDFSGKRFGCVDHATFPYTPSETLFYPLPKTCSMNMHPKPLSARIQKPSHETGMNWFVCISGYHQISIQLLLTVSSSLRPCQFGRRGRSAALG